MIELKNVKKIYDNGAIKVEALKNINLKIDKGEFVAIIGSSGSGKSTLLHLLGGLDSCTSGRILVDETNIGNMDDDEMSKYRLNKVGFIFQFFNLIPILNVLENITLPLRIAKKEIDNDYLKELLNMLGIDKRINHLPSQLSGGQQQRVAIARALLTNPSIILADEPTGNLDSENSNEVIELLKCAARKFNQTVLIVTHDNEVAEKADRIIEMKDGVIISDKRSIS